MKKSTKQAIIGATVFGLIGATAAYVAGEPAWVMLVPITVGSLIAYFAIDNK